MRRRRGRIKRKYSQKRRDKKLNSFRMSRGGIRL